MRRATPSPPTSRSSAPNSAPPPATRSRPRRRSHRSTTRYYATVNRESKARKQRNAKALKRQQKWGNKLLSQLQATTLAEDQTWRAVAKLVSAQKLTGRFTAEQDAAGISNLLGRLKAGGISAAEVKRLASSALVANPVDLLAN